MLDLFNDCLVSLPFPRMDKTSDIRLLWLHLLWQKGQLVFFILQTNLRHVSKWGKMAVCKLYAAIHLIRKRYE